MEWLILVNFVAVLGVVHLDKRILRRQSGYRVVGRDKNTGSNKGPM